MVKKVKRFVVFLLFSFFYSLLFSKTAEAMGKVCLVPKSGDNLKYNGRAVSRVSAASVAAALCGEGY